MPQGEHRTRWKLMVHYFLAMFLLVHSGLYLLYWAAVGRFRLDVDAFLASVVSLDLPYTVILMVLAGLLALWSLFRFVGFRLQLNNAIWNPSPLNWVYFVVSLLFGGLFYGTFIILFQEEPGQRGVLIHLLNLVRVVGDAFLFLLAASWLRRLILFLRKRAAAARHKWFWMVGVILCLVCLIGIWLIPTLFPPSWAYQGALPSRPALIAHRGASMLSPENTLASLELASVMQALGYESDVRISLDGIPFLMHDDSLSRTTNIAEVYPDRVDDRPSSFTMEELKQLNAGLWFIQKDPYGTIDSGMVSQTQLAINQGQKIPTLKETLELIKNNGLVFLFDLRCPSEPHPYKNSCFEAVFKVLQESTLNGDIWFLLDQDQLQVVQEQAPQMTRVAGLSSTNLISADIMVNSGYEIINVDTGISSSTIQAYRQKGLGVNVYTIDETWLFSQFWLTGVTSITTNNVHTFSQLDAPLLAVPYTQYLLAWSVFGIVMAIWLAGSQPASEEKDSADLQTPDLLDFATDDDETVDTTASGFIDEERD